MRAKNFAIVDTTHAMLDASVGSDVVGFVRTEQTPDDRRRFGNAVHWRIIQRHHHVWGDSYHYN